MNQIALPTNPGLLFILACILLTLCYVSYWFLSHSEGFINFLAGSGNNIRQVVTRGLTGFVLMGLVPALVLIILNENLINWGLNVNELGFTLKWVGIWLPIIVISAFFTSKSKSHQEVYPYIRNKVWTLATFVIDFSVWALYLFGYELLFRGVFLFAALKVMGNIEAIFISSVVYSFAHLPKGKNETIGSFFVGLGVSYMTVLTGSILFALLFHIIMAWSNSFFSFFRNPQMKFNGR